MMSRQDAAKSKSVNTGVVRPIIQAMIDSSLALVARDYTEAAYVARHVALYEELIHEHRRAG